MYIVRQYPLKEEKENPIDYEFYGEENEKKTLETIELGFFDIKSMHPFSEKIVLIKKEGNVEKIIKTVKINKEGKICKIIYNKK
jgi:hypothetical protein